MEWTKQQLRALPLPDVFPVARALMVTWLAEGKTVGRPNFDPHADTNTRDGYIGISNKQLKMAAAQILDNPDVTMDEAWELFMWMAFGEPRAAVGGGY
jgi:hypothetical protein